MAGRDDAPLVIGKIVGAFGLLGWVKVESYSREREEVLAYSQWLVRRGHAWQEVDVLDGRRQGQGLVARIAGCDTREAAEVLAGSDIAVHRHQLETPPPGAFYWADLEGLEVTNTRGQVLGTVSHLFETGANDVLVIRSGTREILVPYLRDVILDVDLDRRSLRVDWEVDDED